MTLNRTDVAHDQLSWPLGLRRATDARPALRSIRRCRRALGWIAAAFLEVVILLGTVTALLGIGFEGQTGPLPAPAPAPSYEFVPAPVPDAGRLLAAAPLPAPARLVAPGPVAAGD